MELRAKVRRAKKAYWNSIISGAKSLPDAYKIVRWHNNVTKYQLPPLRNNDTSDLHHEPRAKALFLHKEILCRHLDTEDIQADTPTVAQQQIPWQKFSREEAYRATCKVSSTSPGDDEITAEILRLSWQVLGDRITLFFNCCIQFGTHPKVFKTANIIIVPKSGKRDRSQPKSYRPIALLSCLGKGLERLISRRVSYWALKLKILARDQCSAISRRSASDLTTALVCDINKAWEDKKVAGIITTDVKGAFDGILRNRLSYRLRSQGWPENIVQWGNSFMSERSAQIHLDQTKTEPLPILCGLPQGSPISPILFLLYVEPLLRLSRGRFGYADDTAIFATGRTLIEFHSKLQFQLDRTLAWGK